jgi:tRNA-(ms[2]io[6]A)-hydroxylase
VLRELQKRNLKLGKQRKDDYVNELMKFQEKGGSRVNSLVEKLLTFALIEARSAERFRLLSLNISELELRDFYHQFMVSEAGHYKMFLSLAKKYGGEDEVQKRWQEFLEYEAQILKNIPTRGDRMH